MTLTTPETLFMLSQVMITKLHVSPVFICNEIKSKEFIFLQSDVSSEAADYLPIYFCYG